tara:strand:- start:1757 stop:2779 length:1023 start_codon:yes stop_codon:yes gene_type:complete
MALPYNNSIADILKGTVNVKSGGSWRYADRVWVKKNNQWGTVEEIHVKQGGSWKQVGEYNKYHFKFDLWQNNDGTSSKTYNYHMLNWNSGSNDDYTGQQTTKSSTGYVFELTNALVYSSPWNSTTPVLGVVYVNSWQRQVRIDNLPAGSRVVVYVNGSRRIIGKGGNGGNGSQTHSAGGNGGNGQTALYVRGDGSANNTALINNGQIGGGGGGGGGGRGGQCVYNQQGQQSCMKGSQCPVTYQNFSQEQGGGGGGGAGYPGGSAGSGDPNGQAGQASSGGSGGFTNTCGSQRGRNGGNFGQNGQTLGGTAGSAGTAGNAIDGISYINKIVSGTINGNEVN